MGEEEEGDGGVEQEVEEERLLGHLQTSGDQGSSAEVGEDV